MAQTRLFMSHSHEDNEWCRPFAEALKAVGYDVWYDETGLTGGAQWIATIQQEVQSRDVFLLVLTPEAWSSQWVQDELQLAIATRRRILPLLLRNCQVDGFLLTTQWVTVVGEEPQGAARSAIMAIEAPPAPGRNSAPQAATETLDDLMTLCRSLFTENRYTEALSASSRALTLDPNNAEVIYLRGRMFLKINDYYKACEAFGRALSVAQGNYLRAWTSEVVDLINAAPNPVTWTGDSTALGVAKYGPLITNLTTGVAMYELIERLTRNVRNEAFLRQLVAEVLDPRLLRTAVAVAKDRHATLMKVEPWRITIDDPSKKEAWKVPFCLLAEGCYGYPPDRATPADVEYLQYYRAVLTQLLGFKRECEVVEQYIKRLSRQG